MRTAALFLLLLAPVQDPDIQALLGQLVDDAIDVRDRAAAQLVTMGDKAEEAVRAHLANAEGDLKAQCESILKRIARDKVVHRVLPPLVAFSVDAKDVPVKDVLAELKRKTRLAFDDVASEKKVTVKLTDAAPIEALDAILAAAGLGYSIEVAREEMVLVRRGMGGAGEALSKIDIGESYVTTAPRAFVRHYLVQACEIALTRKNDFKAGAGSGSVDVKMAWIPGVRPSSLSSFVVTAVADDKGRALFDGAAIPGRHSYQMDPRITAQFTYPAPDATSVTVRGKATLQFILERQTIAFEKVLESQGQTREFDGLTIALKRVDSSGTGTKVDLEITGRRRTGKAGGSGFPIQSQEIFLKVADGSRFNSNGSSGSGDGTVYKWSLDFRRAAVPVALEFEFVKETLDDAFEFELKNVPLPK